MPLPAGSSQSNVNRLVPVGTTNWPFCSVTGPSSPTMLVTTRLLVVCPPRFRLKRSVRFRWAESVKVVTAWSLAMAAGVVPPVRSLIRLYVKASVPTVVVVGMATMDSSFP